MALSKKEFATRIVSITAERIANSIDRNDRHCPIAEAVTNTFPELSMVKVDLQLMRMSDREQKLKYRVLTPTRLQQFIVDFDRGYKDRLVPFDFKLGYPALIIKSKTPSPEAKERQKAHREAWRNTGNQGNPPPLPRAPFKHPKRKVVRNGGDNFTIIGGSDFQSIPQNAAPGNHGNIIRKRLFGVRELIP